MKFMHVGVSVGSALFALGLAACGGGAGVPPDGPSALGNSAAVANSHLGLTLTQSSVHLSPYFNERGNLVISDQFNNRVVEIDPPSHQIVWSFGDGSSVAGPHSIVGVNDAERVGRFTLIAGTGVPPASPPLEPGCGSGCPDNRVILVNAYGSIVWQYGKAGLTGSGFNELNTPVQNTFLPNRHVLITDQGNQRVIEVNRDHQIVWQYGKTGVSGIGHDLLNNPNSAELLENGHVLIADENNNRVIEVDRAKNIVWQYPKPLDSSKLSGAAFASRFEGGNTLITDSNNNRILEIRLDGTVVWAYSTVAAGGNSNPLPTRAIRLIGGDNLISDQFNDRVIRVTKTGPTSGAVVFTQGALNMPGNTFDRLNAPYDAKAVRDFSGQTFPFPGDDDSVPIGD